MPLPKSFPRFEVCEVQHGAGPELGCFATVDMADGTPIWEFTGPTFTYAEMAERVRAGVERSGDDPLQVGGDRFMDLEHPAVCFNHSCDPNAALRGTAELVAVRAIRAGEEIRYDYSLTIPASNTWVMAFGCACGADACRGTLGNRLTVPKARVRELLAKRALQDFVVRELLPE
ncbi:MAG: SET domain-containing protein [Myxococcota bacterium]